MDNLMVDIESLGTKLNSVITQIGACYFSKEGEIGDKFLVNIDIQTCLDLGLEIQKRTLLWWLERVHLITWTKETLGLSKALFKFREFCQKNKKAKVWCHATFDIPLLENAYEKLGQRLPFSYKLVRDIRTLVDLSRIKREKGKEDPKTHNALDDCIYQVNYVVNCLKKVVK